MDELGRHFVTSVLGRGFVKASFNESGELYVELTFFELANGKSVWMRVIRGDPDVSGLAGQDLLFHACRIAIARAKVMMTEGIPFSPSAEKLALTMKPWKGDLTEAPFGGPTLGCARLFN